MQFTSRAQNLALILLGLLTAALIAFAFRHVSAPPPGGAPGGNRGDAQPGDVGDRHHERHR